MDDNQERRCGFFVTFGFLLFLFLASACGIHFENYNDLKLRDEISQTPIIRTEMATISDHHVKVASGETGNNYSRKEYIICLVLSDGTEIHSQSKSLFELIGEKDKFLVEHREYRGKYPIITHGTFIVYGGIKLKSD